MRRLGHDRHAARTAAHDLAFFQRMRQQIDGQALLLCLHNRLPAADIKENLSLRQPIRPLLQVARQQNVGLGQDPSDKLSSQGRRVVKKEKRLPSASGNSWIEAAKLPFPFRLEQIPPRLDLLPIDAALLRSDPKLLQKAVVDYLSSRFTPLGGKANIATS